MIWTLGATNNTATIELAPFESKAALACGYNWTYSLDTKNTFVKAKLDEYIKVVSTDKPSIALTAP